MQKSQLKGLILTLFLGPLGLFYASVPAAVALAVAASAIGYFTSDLPLGFWPISMVVSLVMVRRHNAKARQDQLRVGPGAESAGLWATVSDEEEGRAGLFESRERMAEALSEAGDMLNRLEAASAIDRPGFVDGEHVTAYVDDVKLLKREKRHEEAIALLLRLIAAIEAESRDSGGAFGVSPWYYEQLAIVYRKEGRFRDEVALLERYAGQAKHVGAGSRKLGERLRKAREIASKEVSKAERDTPPAQVGKVEERRAGAAVPGDESVAHRGGVGRRKSGQAGQGRKRDRAEPGDGIGADPDSMTLGTDEIANVSETQRAARTEESAPQGREQVLSDFRLPSAEGLGEVRKAPGASTAGWVRPGEEVRVGGFRIRKGNFYFGSHLAGLDVYDPGESSLIDPSLETDGRFPDHAGSEMSYSPRYSRMSPRSRAAFLAWLASDRDDPKTYVGYVFLHFYGIERRLLIDDGNGEVSDDERSALMHEVKRLKRIYGGHRSFAAYASALLSHTWALNYLNPKVTPDPDLMVSMRGYTSTFKVLLAQAVQDGKAVSAELALAWVKSHPQYVLRTPAQRCPEEFDALFKMRYGSRFGEGLKIAPNGVGFALDYSPASPSLRGYPSATVDLPDVSRLKEPHRTLHSLAEDCTRELAQFSRYVGGEGNSKDSLHALSLLPGDLAPSLSSPRLQRWRSWMENQILESGGLVSVKSMFLNAGEEVPRRVNEREAEMLAKMAQMAGFGIAPDIRFHQARPDVEGKVVLFPEGHGEEFSPSSEFKKVGTVVRLGSLVAATDEHVSESEVSALENVVENDSRLTLTEKRSLRAYLTWRLNSAPNKKGLKRRLDGIPSTEKAAISHILVGVALADGKVEPSEIDQLEKLYLQLGLDKAMVAGDIHRLSSRKPSAADREGTASAQIVTETQSGPPSGFSLDRDLLRLYEEETREAQLVLESIFVEEEFEDGPDSAGDAPGGSGAFTGLDAKSHQLYLALISKETWSREEMEGLCSGLQLMPEGALETINDWAFDRVGAPLVEDGDSVFVDLELAEELAELEQRGHPS